MNYIIDNFGKKTRTESVFERNIITIEEYILNRVINTYVIALLRSLDVICNNLQAYTKEYYLGFQSNEQKLFVIYHVRPNSTQIIIGQVNANIISRATLDDEIRQRWTNDGHHAGTKQFIIRNNDDLTAITPVLRALNPA